MQKKFRSSDLNGPSRRELFLLAAGVASAAVAGAPAADAQATSFVVPPATEAVAPPLSQVTWPLRRNPPPWGGDNVARQRCRCDSTSPPALHAARSRLESLLASGRIFRSVPFNRASGSAFTVQPVHGWQTSIRARPASTSILARFPTFTRTFTAKGYLPAKAFMKSISSTRFWIAAFLRTLF